MITLAPFHSVSLIVLMTALLSACADKDTPEPTPQPVEKISYLTSTPGPGFLTPEALHADPTIDGSSLRHVSISPDGSRVSVLRGRADDAGQQDLWAYDLDTGEAKLLVSSTDLLGAPETLSDEEKNRRERAREYGKGIVSYTWAGDNLLLFPLGGDVYTYDLTTRKAQQVTATKGFETDAKVSKSGRYASYVRDNNLFVKDLKNGLERQLSDGATDLIRNATASFVVQEELGRDTGYWWSPTEDRLAYTQIDESNIAIENRIEFSSDKVENISQRYPFAGTKNATVKLGVVNRDGGETLWVDIGDDPDIYLTRVLWSTDGTQLYAGILSRNQKTHTFLKIDPDSGASSVLWTETSDTWVNVGNELTTLSDGNLLWPTEASGRSGLVEITDDGTARSILPDNLHLNSLECVDPDTDRLYFTAWQNSPLVRHVFHINRDGTELTQLSNGDGLHSAAFSENCAKYIDTYSTADMPLQSRVFNNDGTAGIWLNENKLDAAHPYAPYLDAHISPEYGILLTDDGTELYYELYKPLDLKPGEKRAAITLVYNGPGVQRVNKGWAKKNFARMLAHHGFVVFQLDGRGGTNRDKSFEDGLYRALGTIEVEDQTTGANWLKSQDFVDPERMGVYGWSYGGYMVSHMLARTELYTSGVIGAPVTDWALYDTAYTERYLGSPDPASQNYTQGAYENGSVFPYLDGLTEPFLLIHGMADDNVVFRHSIQLMDAMQSRGAQNMRVMTYPGEKHGFRKTDNKIHRDRLILEYFLDTLAP